MNIAYFKPGKIRKVKGLCRQMTIPSLADALVLQCLADAYWQDIKSRAPTSNAHFEPKDHTFSRDDDGNLEYGSIKSWLDFQEDILGFARKCKFIIITDITNYYDFIDFDQLRNVIVSLIRIREPIVDFLMHILSGMCWKPDYMPSRNIGMPQMDIDAPRLLAHSFLFELDALMQHESLSNYARFMDDIDAGADSIAGAKRNIKKIDLTLQTRNLRLNSGKTLILSHSEAIQHFKVVENRMLNIIKKLVNDGDKLATKKMTSKLYGKWLKKGNFNTGNGEKILKRIIGLAIGLDLKLDQDSILDIIKLRPNLRGNALNYLSHVGFSAKAINFMFELLKSEYICDDYFMIEFSKSLFHGRVSESKITRNLINDIIDWLKITTKTTTIIVFIARLLSAIDTSIFQKRSLFWREAEAFGRMTSFWGV